MAVMVQRYSGKNDFLFIKWPCVIMCFMKIHSINIHIIYIYMYINHFIHFTIVCMLIYIVDPNTLDRPCTTMSYHLQYTF